MDTTSSAAGPRTARHWTRWCLALVRKHMVSYSVSVNRMQTNLEVIAASSILCVEKK